MSHGAGIHNFAFMARAARHVVPASAGFDPAELVALSNSVGRLCLFAAATLSPGASFTVAFVGCERIAACKYGAHADSADYCQCAFGFI